MRTFWTFLFSSFIGIFLVTSELSAQDTQKIQGVDWGLAGLRFAMVGGSVAGGSFFEFQADPIQALVIGSTAGGLSASLMLIHPQLVRWLSSKGLFQLSQEKNAGFLEMHFKEFLVSFGFNYSVQMASSISGLSENGLSPFAPALMAVIALPTQGIWELSISRSTQDLLKLFPHKSSSIWMMSKLAIITNSAVSTFAAVSTMLGAEWTGYLLAAIGVSGFASFGLGCTTYGKCLLKTAYSNCKASLQTLKKRLEPKLKDE
jgi:hypothetical protein